MTKKEALLRTQLNEARQLIAWAAPLVAEHAAFVGNQTLADVMIQFLAATGGGGRTGGLNAHEGVIGVPSVRE